MKQHRMTGEEGPAVAVSGNVASLMRWYFTDRRRSRTGADATEWPRAAGTACHVEEAVSLNIFCGLLTVGAKFSILYRRPRLASFQATRDISRRTSRAFVM